MFRNFQFGINSKGIDHSCLAISKTFRENRLPQRTTPATEPSMPSLKVAQCSGNSSKFDQNSIQGSSMNSNSKRIINWSIIGPVRSWIWIYSIIPECFIIKSINELRSIKWLPIIQLYTSGKYVKLCWLLDEYKYSYVKLPIKTKGYIKQLFSYLLHDYDSVTDPKSTARTSAEKVVDEGINCETFHNFCRNRQIGNAKFRNGFFNYNRIKPTQRTENDHLLLDLNSGTMRSELSSLELLLVTSL